MEVVWKFFTFEISHQTHLQIGELNVGTHGALIDRLDRPKIGAHSGSMSGGIS